MTVFAPVWLLVLLALLAVASVALLGLALDLVLRLRALAREFQDTIAELNAYRPVDNYNAPADPGLIRGFHSGG